MSFLGWLGLLAAAAVAVALWRLYRRGQQIVLAERERHVYRVRRQLERERARSILEGRVEPLTDPPLELAAGERAYYRTPASRLEPEGQGDFRRAARGELVVTNRGAYFLSDGQVLHRHRMAEIERIDVPFADVIALISFRDTLTRDEERTYYQVDEPLVAAAHISRFTAFELILD